VVPDLGRTGPLCFISEDTRRRAAEYAPWSLDDSAVVYSGIDGRLFTAADGPRSSWAGHLLYVGRFDPRKGVETAVRALTHLEPSTTLELQGTGDDSGARDRLAALAAELGVAERVSFGSCSRAELVARYQAADALLFPSEWEEPFGLTPLEAMACGTPVVATGVGGSGEFLLDGRNCVRFAPGDPVALADAVRRLAARPELRERLRDSGHRTAQVLDVDRLTDALEAWLRWAVDPSTPRPPSRSFEAELADAR
jgi:glycosyltransferase involved in cell wall biosynthesis